MRRHDWSGCVASLAVLATVALSGARGLADEVQAEAEAAATAEAAAGDAGEGDDGYAVGLVFRPVSPALQAHFGLSPGEGLAVHRVVPGSPAEKADLAEHDVLVAIGGAAIDSADVVARAVADSGGKQLKLEVFHGGKRVTRKVQPVPRSEVDFGPLPPLAAGGRPADWPEGIPFGNEEVRKWIERMQKEGGGPLRFRGIGPGIVLGAPDKMPQGMSMLITRQNEEPAQIKVSKDGQTWEVTEEEFDKLPDDVRRHVERALGGAGQRAWQIPRPGRRGAEGRAGGDFGPLEQRLEEMDRRMQRMMEELRGMRRDRPGQRGEKKADSNTT